MFPPLKAHRTAGACSGGGGAAVAASAFAAAAAVLLERRLRLRLAALFLSQKTIETDKGAGSGWPPDGARAPGRHTRPMVSFLLTQRSEL